MDETSIVSVADKKGDIVSYNQKYLEISKYSPKELAGAQHSITRHADRSEEHTSELQSLMRTSYVAFCLTKKYPHDIMRLTSRSHLNILTKPLQSASP